METASCRRRRRPAAALHRRRRARSRISRDYSADQLAELPADAVVNSFGCGNPVALAGLRAGDDVVDLGSGAGIDLLLAARSSARRAG